MTAAPPVVANRYRLLEPLGVGGMGRVWRARDETLHRDVAVKQIILPPELLDTARDVAMERTLREARAAARLSHPNVVRVYDVLAAEGQPWLVMEYVRSRSLDQVIRQDGPLPPRRVAEIGLAVLDALRAAQKVGVDHRDIKPGNVLLAEDGRVVLTDFGIARVEGEGHVTRTGLVLGSPEFIAPERAREGIAGPASDLWSLGATLYTAVEGRSPFGRGSAMETLTALASEEADPPQRAGPLAPVLRALLRKDPKTRANFVQTDELLRKALIQREPAKKKRSWLSGWGRAEPAAPAVPAQRTPRTRPEPVALPESGSGGQPGAVSGGRAGAVSGGRAVAPVARGAAAPVAPPLASPAGGSAGAAVAGGAVGGALAAEAAPSVVRGKAAVPPSTWPPVPPADENPTDGQISGKSGIIEGPIFGAAADDEAAEDEFEAETAEPLTATETDSDDDADADADAEIKADEAASLTTTESAAETSTEPEAVEETEPEPELEPEPGAAVVDEAEDEGEVEAEAVPEPEPITVVTPEPEPEPEPVREAVSAQPAAAVGAFTAGAAPVRERPTQVAPAAAPRVAGQAVVVPGQGGTDAGKRRRNVLVGCVAAVLVAAVLVWLVVRSDDEGAAPTAANSGAVRTTAAGAGPAPSSAAATSAAATGEASSAPAGNVPSTSSTQQQQQNAGTASGTLPPLPAGWQDYRDPTGFQVYVPAGWTKSLDGTMVYFRGNGRTLGIDQSTKPKMDPVADWRQQESERGGSYYKNYTGVRIDKVDNYFVVAADWEFIYGNGNRQHVNNRGLVTSDHQAYAIWWATPEGDWNNAKADLDVIFASFRPKP
ncbi:serine/threonine-protein kinase [Dactylosporangium sp. NPDC051541]|uniref:serine/threonine-protein kinase n=1 Tax=Dactylosporangium sp. NPDC051541 TaxID=3363977 RepID=UPI0037B4E5F4